MIAQTTAQTAYTSLKSRFARIATLDEAAGLLSWDASAMMPPGGAAARGEQMAVLAGLSHELLTAPGLADDLAAAEAPDEPVAQMNLALMREAQKRASALPRDLVEAASIANTACETIWRQARPASDFAMVAPALTEVFNLARQSAGILGEALGLTPYDALLTQFQHGITAADVTPIFARYETFLAAALPAAEARQAAPESLPPGPYPAALQEELCHRLAAAVGLKFSGARLDRSAHPACGGIPSDIRITLRYDEQDCTSALMGVLHESGHGLYEADLPKALARQPAGFAAGMAAHESQSLIIEMQAARSDAYLSYLGSLLTKTFGHTISHDALKSRLRRVERSFIRVEADELTYPAHVLLRFRLEQALMSGDLAVRDLPGAWNDGLHALLGITPSNDRHGCLQDIHWYDGLIGYFPSYTLGAIAAAQLMQAARLALPTLEEALSQGDFTPLTHWLHHNVHTHGATLGFNDLLRTATGKPLSLDDFEAHLTKRYLS